ncbi:MAG TPA: tripartite tricarboxylate transporter substrate binding protein [Burkholderiales bacterium]|jgi:tripartite-type tricarboxylate transporter receptor subunit TctC
MIQMLVLLAAIAAAPALAQDAYPSRPITMVIAFPPGGVADITARPTALTMEKMLKHRVIIENRPGAAGATGNAYVANAKPDGYTVLMALSSVSVIPEAERLHGRKPPYELAQFAPIALISADPVVLVVRDEAPWKNVSEFISDARQRPGKITYSSSGIYGALHMPFTLLEHATGITLWHVPYNGGGPAIQALLGSQVDVTVGGPATMIGQIKGKRLRPLASFGNKRLASLPDVPTLKELGIDAEYFIWAGLLAPRATPPALQQTLRNAVRQTVEDPEFRAAMAKVETPISYLDAPEFQKFWDADAAKLAEAVKRTGLVEQRK